MSNWAFYEKHFGEARLAHYLVETNHDADRAAELYRWNVYASGAFSESLAYFEVAFRNAVDHQLMARHDRLGRPGHWIYDEARELGRDKDGPGRHKAPFRDVADAMKRVRQNRKTINPGQIISELPFGAWHQLVSKRQVFLWPDLASAFRHAPSRSQTAVSEPVRRIRQLRNRISHHHRIWSHDIGGRLHDLLTVAGYMDPDLRTFIEQRSRLPQLLEQRRRSVRG